MGMENIIFYFSSADDENRKGIALLELIAEHQRDLTLGEGSRRIAIPQLERDLGSGSIWPRRQFV